MENRGDCGSGKFFRKRKGRSVKIISLKKNNMNRKMSLVRSKIWIFLICIACFHGTVFAQAPAFYAEVQAFKKLDSIHPPVKNAILLIGSSSFTKWVDVQDYFPLFPIVNRGFGGSTLPDVIRYAEEVIFPYAPKQILIYCGENDLASADSVSSRMVFNRFKQLFQIIRTRLPKVSVAFVSMKPSPSRERLWPKMVEGNELIKNYLQKKKNTSYIDVYPKMFDQNGIVMKDIFLKDNLHMNAKGYAIWQKIMAPYLLP
jgi:lysophospholipase L1-like esterase